MEIKNLKKASNRIKKAIKNNERIILYGDADLDGAASVIILKDSIKSLGGEVSDIYFPDREKEGYGITEKGLKFLEKQAPALLIALDCGISNFKEVKTAKKIGFEVMIIDHHQILDKLPEAKIIVDPKQKGDNYPFKEFANAGLAFKLSEILLKNKLTENLRKNFLEMVALATIADMMPQESENKIFIEEGIYFLENSWRPGIKAFMEIKEIRDLPNIRQKISKIVSILNIRNVQGRLPACFRLLDSCSLEEAETIIIDLLEKSKIEKKITEEIEAEVENRISKKDESIIFEGSSDFELVLISTVASRICRKYNKPVFLYKKMAEESHGTVRSPKDIDSVALMKKCSEYLLSFGGHAPASGFRLKNENIEKFKNCLIRNICEK